MQASLFNEFLLIDFTTFKGITSYVIGIEIYMVRIPFDSFISGTKLRTEADPDFLNTAHSYTKHRVGNSPAYKIPSSKCRERANQCNGACKGCAGYGNRILCPLPASVFDRVQAGIGLWLADLKKERKGGPYIDPVDRPTELADVLLYGERKLRPLLKAKIKQRTRLGMKENSPPQVNSRKINSP